MFNMKMKQHFSQRLGSADETIDLQSIVKFTVNVVNEKGSFSKHKCRADMLTFFALVQAIESAAATTVTVKAEQ